MNRLACDETPVERTSREFQNCPAWGGGNGAPPADTAGAHAASGSISRALHSHLQSGSKSFLHGGKEGAELLAVVETGRQL